MTEATCRPAHLLPQEWGDRRAAGGVCSSEALARLYATHAAPLYRYFWMRTRSQSLAEDLVSETFLGALRSLPGYSPERGTLGAWLYGIARRTLARHAGEMNKVAAIAQQATAMAAGQARAMPPAVSIDERIDLWQAVAQLSDVEQEAVALRFGAACTYPEIARIMGLQPTHVGVLLYRALQRLRTQLRREEHGDVS